MLAGRHRAVAEIDLEAIRHNVRRLMRDLPAGAVHCAVVKADGYGHGAVPAARAALEAGSTWLGVATAPEAEELRAAGFTAPILIFGPLTGAGLERAGAAGAEVVAWSAPFIAEAVRLGVRVHVKYDTGMGRLGVPRHEVIAFCAQADAGGVLSGLMSHFATADEADTSFFEQQLARFTELAGTLKEQYPGLICHTANSAATLRGPRAHFDMVRTGIAMYGLAPGNDDPFKDGLRPAMKLASYIAGVREAATGDSVGYGRTFVAEEPTRIGIVPIGYADGVRARARQPRRGARRRAALPHRRPDQHGPDDGASARRLGRAGRRGRPVRRRRRRRGREAPPSPGRRRTARVWTPPRRRASSAKRWRGSSGPSTTRSRATWRRGWCAATAATAPAA